MRFEDRLACEITGEVFFDRFNRGRYATDASFYQIMPAGVVVPRTIDEALRTLSIARDDGRIVTPRGGGTSQCGQTVNHGIVIDFSKHLNRVISLDVENRTAWSSRESCSMTSTGSSNNMACGFRSMSPPRRAPPSAAWPATIPAAAARCARHHAR